MAEETMRIVVEQVSPASLDTNIPASGNTDSRVDVAAQSDNGAGNLADSSAQAATKLGRFVSAIEFTREALGQLETKALDFAQKLEGIGPQVSSASAMRDVRMQQSLLEADKIAGKELAALIEATSRQDAAWNKIDATMNKWGAIILQPIEDIKAYLLEKLAEAIQKANEIAERAREEAQAQAVYLLELMKTGDEAKAAAAKRQFEQNLLEKKKEGLKSSALNEIFKVVDPPALPNIRDPQFRGVPMNPERIGV